jgi:Zn-dependent protease with chaperone function
MKSARRTSPPLGAAVALLFALGAPVAALGQASPTPSKSDMPARAPIPPGVPTDEHNFHLPTEGEVKLGREGSEEVEKYYKVISSGPYHERLQRVAKDVVRAMERTEVIRELQRVYNLPKRGDKSRRVPFEWSFKVVDGPRVERPGGGGREINAFSLAGGPIYFTRGLMDYAPSDHELAAVLAHECAHVAFHHVEQLVKKQRKASQQQIWTLLAALLIGAAGGGQAGAAASNVAIGAQLVSIATLTGYGRELEHEADRVGVLALAGTDYHPLGMLTFMQKLARDDHFRGNPDYGIFQSHPYSNERVAALKKQLVALGYKTDPGTQRAVSLAFRVTTEPTRIMDRPAIDLRLNGNLLYTVVAGDGDLTPAQRATRMASQIEGLFYDNLTYNDVKRSPDKSMLLLKGIPVIRVFSEDAAVAGSPEAATERAYREIIRALLKEQIDKPFGD